MHDVTASADPDIENLHDSTPRRRTIWGKPEKPQSTERYLTNSTFEDRKDSWLRK